MAMPKLNPLQRVREVAAKGFINFAARFELWAIKKSCLGHIDGIAICDNSIVQQDRDGFHQLTRQALALIQSLDPRRYRRVCRHLDYIVNMELISAGNFNRAHKICRMDYSKFTTADPLWNLRQYAQLLVHEATHGLLFEEGIEYDRKTRERIEKLCRLEEYRFALHFEPGYAEASVPPFNSEWYKTYWDGEARRAAEWERLWEAVKARKKAGNNVRDGAAAVPAPMDAKAYHILGESYQRERNYAKAISYFTHAIQLDPQFAQAYCNRGLTYRYESEYDKAIADYGVALRINPQFALAYNNRSYAYYCKGEYDKSIADCDRAIQLIPDYKTAYINRARTHRTAGNYEKAMADYSRLIDLAPKYASAYNNLAWILAACPRTALRNGRKAVELATKACELSEWKKSSAINTLALACAEVADFEIAAKWQTRYLESPDLSPDQTIGAKKRLALYQAHIQGEHNRN